LEERLGFVAEFSAGMIRHGDIRYFGSAREDLISLSIEYGRLCQMEIMIDGYDDDPRSLYEVPEVRRWFALVQDKWPDALLWLTPGSLWTCMLALHPETHQRLPDGRLQIAFMPEDIQPGFVESLAEGLDVLERGGLGNDAIEGVKAHSIETFSQMLQRKQFGDYVVVHPRTGEVLTYRLES